MTDPSNKGIQPYAKPETPMPTPTMTPKRAAPTGNSIWGMFGSKRSNVKAPSYGPSTVIPPQNPSLDFRLPPSFAGPQQSRHLGSYQAQQPVQPRNRAYDLWNGDGNQAQTQHPGNQYPLQQAQRPIQPQLSYQHNGQFVPLHPTHPNHQYPNWFSHQNPSQQYSNLNTDPGVSYPPEWPSQSHVPIQQYRQAGQPFLHEYQELRPLTNSVSEDAALSASRQGHRKEPRTEFGDDDSDRSEYHESYSESENSASDDEDESSDEDSHKGPDFGEFSDVAAQSKSALGLDSRRVDSRGITIGRRNSRRRKGPRKAAEMTGPIRFRVGRANEFFMNGDYAEARDLAWEVIRLNAETFEAWVLLLAIYTQYNDMDKALEAQWRSCHLRPKQTDLWISCAENAADHGNLVMEELCYRTCLRLTPSCIEARLGKARVFVKKEKYSGAIIEYKKILAKWSPHNLDVIRDLAAAYFDTQQINHALDLYKEEFVYLQANSDESGQMIDWNDVCAYCALYELQDSDHATALKEIKSLARWLLGRQSQKFFDDITDSDCEWDSGVVRRLQVPGFPLDKFPDSAYGDGLPLELRVKLGILRLNLGDYDEAMQHLSHLTSANELGESRLPEYQDLYLQVGNCMAKLGRHLDALEFYRPLLEFEEQRTPSLHLQMAKSNRLLGVEFQAEKHFKAAIELDPRNTDAHVELAKLYEDSGKYEEAAALFNKVEEIQKPPPPKPKRLRKLYRVSAAIYNDEDVEEGQTPLPFNAYPKLLPKPPQGAEPTVLKPITPRVRREKGPLSLAPLILKGQGDGRWTEQLDRHYSVLRNERDDMRNGSVESRKAWIEAAKALTNHFQDNRLFYYPTGLPTKFRPSAVDLPSVYQNIHLSEWLDIFLEYALCLAKHGEAKESYEICASAKTAVVFSRSRDDLFLIHVAWCICAILAGDEKTCVQVTILFIQDYRFTTDAYRLFSAAARMCNSPLSWYGSSASRDLVLQHVKSMDYALCQEKRGFNNTGDFATPDGNGGLINKKTMDVALLMLYGHIIYAGGSYITALNYYLRARALEPDNPVIHLSIGLSYINFALTGRPAENQDQAFLQGLSFMKRYYESRKSSPEVDSRQEAHYNMGRVYQMLGQGHLAIPYYNLVFKEVKSAGDEQEKGYVVVDAAYNLQALYTTAGNEILANAVTEKWLVL